MAERIQLCEQVVAQTPEPPASPALLSLAHVGLREEPIDKKEEESVLH